MTDVPGDEQNPAFFDVVLEALKGIKSEILLYAVAVAALFVGSASLGIDILRELKWPLLAVFSLGLLAYFFGRAVPRARMRLKKIPGKKTQ
jgi:hypothetical protein